MYGCVFKKKNIYIYIYIYIYMCVSGPGQPMPQALLGYTHLGPWCSWVCRVGRISRRDS